MRVFFPLILLYGLILWGLAAAVTHRPIPWQDPRIAKIGAIHFPGVITEAIQARTQADQQVNAAQARVAVAEAQAREKIAIATGDAEAYRLRGEALRANPQVLEQQAIAKWNGALPQVTGGATPFVNLK